MKYAALVGIVFAMLTLVTTVIGFLVGAAYHPENTSKSYAVLGLVLLAIIASSLPFLWRVRNVEFGIFLKSLSLISGSALSLIGAYLIWIDSGDILLWSLPFLMGVCLLFIFFEAISPTKEAS